MRRGTFFLKSFCLIWLGLIVAGNNLRAQVDTSAQHEIYRQVLRAALQDREISEEEKAILEAVRISQQISPSEAAQIQAEILNLVPKAFDQSGRWELVLQNMFLGAALYGWGIPYVLDVEKSKWYVGGEMLSLGSAYYLTYQLTKKMDISHARAHMFRSGALFGLSWATSLALIMGNNDGKLAVSLMMLGVPIGMLTTDRLYRRWQPSLGQTWALSQWSEVTAKTFSYLHAIIDKEPEYDWMEYDEGYDEDHANWEKKHSIAYSLGLPVGLFIEHYFYGKRQYSFGDGIMLSTGRLTGLIYSILVWDFIYCKSNSDMDSAPGFALRAISSLGGLIAADKLIKGSDYTAGQAILMAAGGISGGLFAVGLGVITEVDESRAYDLLAIGGSLGGFYLTHRIMNIQPESKKDQTHQNLSLYPVFYTEGSRIAGGVHLTLNF